MANKNPRHMQMWLLLTAGDYKSFSLLEDEDSSNQDLKVSKAVSVRVSCLEADCEKALRCFLPNPTSSLLSSMISLKKNPSVVLCSSANPGTGEDVAQFLHFSF